MTDTGFSRGLEGVTAAETRLSHIDAEAGDLTVGGYPIEELAANATYEEAVFLLFEDRLPTADELTEFRTDLAARREIDGAVREVLRQAAAEGVPAMDALRMGLAAANLGSGTDARRDDARAAALRAVAVVPTLVATYWRYREDEAPLTPREDLGHAANYQYMLTGEDPSEAAVRGLETYLTTAIEHGLNASTFAARVVASTGADPTSAATAAVGALKGPRHGSPDAVLEVLEAAHAADDPAASARERVASADGLPGFGHPLYRGRDPRAAVLSAAAERFYDETGDDDFFETAREFEDAAREALAGQHEHDTVGANMELYAVTLLRGVGIPRELFRATFAVARVGGWMAHALEQRAADRLVRPVSRYTGATGRTWTPRGDRYVAGDAVVERPLRSATLEPVSETLATLSEPNRLEILLALYEEGEPVAYSTLRAATSIDDKGQFNYHLRQLRDLFVADREEGYVLTDAGETFVETVLTDRSLLGDV